MVIHGGSEVVGGRGSLQVSSLAVWGKCRSRLVLRLSGYSRTVLPFLGTQHLLSCNTLLLRQKN